MYVCICNAVTDHQIRERASREPVDIADLQREFNLGTRCGRCKEHASDFLGRLAGARTEATGEAVR